MNNTNRTNNIIYTNLTNEEIIKEKYLKWNRKKMSFAKILTVIMIIAALLISKYVFKPSESAEAAKNWVHDKDSVLSDSTIDAINDRNYALYGKTGNKAEVVVVVEKGVSNSRELFKRAEKLFKNYKVSDSGLLFLVSVPEVPASYSANNAVEKFGLEIGEFFDGLFGSEKQPFAYVRGRNADYFSDDRIEEIVTEYFQPSYESGNYNAAVLNTFRAFADYLEKEYTGEIQAYNYNSGSNVTDVAADSPTAETTAPTLFGVIILFAVLFIILGSLNKKKKKNHGSISWGEFFDGSSDSKKSKQ